VLWAILLGLVISNTVGVPEIFRAGVATYEFWLKAGIVLLGARFLIGDVLRLGGISLGLVLIEVTFSLAFMTLLGRAFQLRPKLTTLLAVGSSICGVSAIIATQGAIDADEEDSSYAIGAILALGALSLFVFPLIGHGLHLSDRAYGLWAGLGVDNTAEATAAGALYSDAAGKVAVLAKTCRNALIGFVVLGYAIYWARKGQAEKVTNKAAFLWKKFPKFVLGFLLISLLASLACAAVSGGRDWRGGDCRRHPGAGVWSGAGVALVKTGYRLQGAGYVGVRTGKRQRRHRRREGKPSGVLRWRGSFLREVVAHGCQDIDEGFDVFGAGAVVGNAGAQCGQLAVEEHGGNPGSTGSEDRVAGAPVHGHIP
jgi:uncharacterized integral membrane protein (TIGR00698 family)